MKNSNLNQARKAKKDEFYTQLIDIEKELVYYTEQLCNKIVYCPCDDYRMSNFVKYFKDNFTKLKLKKLIATNYNISKGAHYYEYDGKDEKITTLKGDGDFRSDECIEFLKEADVVVTNPPFSLFREYVAQLMEYDKKFLIIGNMNAITYKEIFPLIRDNRLWAGVNSKGGTRKGNSLSFQTENGEMKDVSSWWFTNIENKRHQTPLDLYKRYTPEEYPKYDNYDAINVNKSSDIPIDYDGLIGVPISFLMFHCPDQFEIVGCQEPCIELEVYKHSSIWKGEIKSRQIIRNGKLCQKTYHRIFIKRK